MTALIALIRKETRHIIRDRRTLTVLLLLPVVQVLLFGYAIRTDVEDVGLIVVDPRPDEATLLLRSRLFGGGVFEERAVLSQTGLIEELFRGDAAQAAIVFEPGFAGRLGRGVPAGVLIITDTTDPNTGAAIQGYLLEAIQSFESEWQSGTERARIVSEARIRFNPTAESKNLFVPGLIGFVLTIISSLMTAITIVREKETGTMETMLVSPLRPWQIITGKVSPYLALGFVSVVAVLLEGLLIFDVPLRGSILLLTAESMIFVIASLALGILISARTSSQRVAMTAALLGTMLPTMILSGFIFPIESMPWPLQWLSHIVPAKWFVSIARGIMLKGVGLSVLWQETLILSAMALLLLIASVRSFRARLE